MRKATKENNTGIRWNFTTTKLDVDVVTLLSNTRKQLQSQANDVCKYAHFTGLKINAAKTSDEIQCQHQPTNPINNTKDGYI